MKKLRCRCFWWRRVVVVLLYASWVLSNNDDSVALGWTIRSDHQSTDRRMQAFWDSGPFKTAESVVFRVLTEPFAPGPLLMTIQEQQQQTAVAAADNNTIFSRFYQGQLQAHEQQQQQYLTTPEHLQENTTSSCNNKRKKKKKTFQLDLAYSGQHFCGWQRQKRSNISSVQAAVEDSLSVHNNGNRPNVRVAGRTDAGVHAVGQMARLRAAASTTDAEADDIFDTLQAAAAAVNHTWRCLAVTRVSDTFHPTFDCQTRSYVYMMDANALAALCRSFGGEELENTVLALDRLLQSLEGKELDYFAFSYGAVRTQSTLCRLVHARARLLEGAVTIEVTGNRFLRRMVRILVSTALQLVVVGSSTVDDEQNMVTALIDLCTAGNRSLTAKAAPPGGLIKVGASMMV